MPPAPPAPLALSDAEVKSGINQAAYDYCLPDAFCYDYGIYVDSIGGPITCASKTVYEWSCYGWNEEYDGSDFYTCDFGEIVSRSGYNRITHRQDLSYGSSGWNCYLS